MGDELIRGDRRVNRRYEMSLELRYKVIRRNRIVQIGTGRTYDLSSGGVLIGTDQPLQPGAFVEVLIQWPLLLENTCQLALKIVGRVVRTSENFTAVKTRSYEFLTRGTGPVSQSNPQSGSRSFGNTSIRSTRF